jgi:hypothetical protein
VPQGQGQDVDAAALWLRWPPEHDISLPCGGLVGGVFLIVGGRDLSVPGGPSAQGRTCSGDRGNNNDNLSVATGGGWHRYPLRAAIDDWQQKWQATRETKAVMYNGGRWHLMVAMNGSNSGGSGGWKIALNGGNYGQRQGDGERMVQWTTTAVVVARTVTGQRR